MGSCGHEAARIKTPVEQQETFPGAAHILNWLERLHQGVLVVSSEMEILWTSKTLRRLTNPEAFGIGDYLEAHFADPMQGEHLTKKLHEHKFLESEPVLLLGLGDEPVRCFINATRFQSETAKPNFLVILRSTDEQARYDRCLQETESYLSGILHCSPEAVISFDPGGVITYANPAAEKLFGIPQSAMLHKPIGLWVRDRRNLESIISALGPGDMCDLYGKDFELERKDGSRVWISVSSSPLRLADGTKHGIVVFLRDVTKRHNIALSLMRKNAELENYVNTVSHDLRSPLTSVLGFAQLLKKHCASSLDATALHFLDRINQAGRSMETLINDLLELSRIGADTGGTEIVDVVQILRQLGAEFKPRLDDARIDLAFPTDLPVIAGSRTHIYQVFSNLIGNAIEHMGPGENRRIAIDAIESDHEIVYTVRDNGRGIPRDRQDLIFEIFRSFAEGVGKHSGIGLAVVHKIAETSGGRVWVESAPGEGAAFHFAVPCPLAEIAESA